MEIKEIRGQKYRLTRIDKSGVITEQPGEIIGARLLTNGLGGRLQLFDAVERNGLEPLLEIICEEGRQDNENILGKIKRYEGGLAATLEGPMVEAHIYHQPFDVAQGIYRILKILEKAYEPQWIQEYQFNLDTAETNKLIDVFPTKPKYLYVRTATGQITVKFDRPTDESSDLHQHETFNRPFNRIYLTWAAQSGAKLTIWVSNKKIDLSTGVKTRAGIVSATIAQTGTISSEVDMGYGFSIIGIEIPTIDNAIVYLQASRTTGGSFRRIQKTDGSGDWNVGLSTGNKMIFCDAVAPFRYFKIEVSAPQNTASRTFYVIAQA